MWGSPEKQLQKKELGRPRRADEKKGSRGGREGEAGGARWEREGNGYTRSGNSGGRERWLERNFRRFSFLYGV